MSEIIIHDQTTVGYLIGCLQKLDPKQRFLTQVILPDGTPWNCPAKIFDIHASDCGDGLHFLGLTMRCDGGKNDE